MDDSLNSDSGLPQDTSSVIYDDDEENPSDYKVGGYHPVQLNEIFLNRYVVVQKLGWGHFSTVWLCKDLKFNTYVAMKIQKSAPHYTEAAYDEIDILLKVSGSTSDPVWVQSLKQYYKDKETRGKIDNKLDLHNYCFVVQLLNSFLHHGPHGKHVCMVFEILGVNLLEIIKRYNYKGIPMPICRVISKEVLIGLDYLHRICGIIHTDLKPENVLLQLTQAQTNEIITHGMLKGRGEAAPITPIKQVPETPIQDIPREIDSSTYTDNFDMGRKEKNRQRKKLQKQRKKEQMKNASQNESQSNIQQEETKDDLHQKALDDLVKDIVNDNKTVQDMVPGAAQPAQKKKRNRRRNKNKKKQADQNDINLPTMEDLDPATDQPPLFESAEVEVKPAHIPYVPTPDLTYQSDPVPSKDLESAIEQIEQKQFSQKFKSLSQSHTPLNPVFHHDSSPILKSIHQQAPDVGENIKIKIADLGNACWVDNHFSTEIQTRQYRSPEVILGITYNYTADIWSFACMLFELVTGDFLFEPKGGNNFGKDDDHLAQMMETLGLFDKDWVLSGRYSKKFFNKYGVLRNVKRLRFWHLRDVLIDKYRLRREEAEALSDFLQPMLKFKPEKRQSAQKSLEHFWLTMPSNYDYRMSDEEYQAHMERKELDHQVQQFKIEKGEVPSSPEIPQELSDEDASSEDNSEISTESFFSFEEESREFKENREYHKEMLRIKQGLLGSNAVDWNIDQV